MDEGRPFRQELPRNKDGTGSMSRAANSRCFPAPVSMERPAVKPAKVRLC